MIDPDSSESCTLKIVWVKSVSTFKGMEGLACLTTFLLDEHPLPLTLDCKVIHWNESGWYCNKSMLNVFVALARLDRLRATTRHSAWVQKQWASNHPGWHRCAALAISAYMYTHCYLILSLLCLLIIKSFSFIHCCMSKVRVILVCRRYPSPQVYPTAKFCWRYVMIHERWQDFCMRV